jgi:hypothetical protein
MAKTYNPEKRQKDVIRLKEKEEAKAKIASADPNAAQKLRREMPERIRINSLPVLAILADIANEKWTPGPKVMLRPYKFLVAHEEEIRERFDLLHELWAQRPRPEDATTSANNVTTYELETLDDEHIWNEGSLHNERQSETPIVLRAARRIDLKTTYDALQNLACLMEFMDDDLCPVVRRYFFPSIYPKIYFRDLWYLF